MKHNPITPTITMQAAENKPLALLSAIVRAFDEVGDRSPAAEYARSIYSVMF